MRAGRNSKEELAAAGGAAIRLRRWHIRYH